MAVAELDYLHTLKDFENAKKNHVKMAIDFTATWCGPCKYIGPKFQAMDANFPDIKFFKVDVDKNNDTAEMLEISAMPTFLFFLNGFKLDDLKLVGASEDKLK